MSKNISTTLHKSYYWKILITLPKTKMKFGRKERKFFHKFVSPIHEFLKGASGKFDGDSRLLHKRNNLVLWLWLLLSLRLLPLVPRQLCPPSWQGATEGRGPGGGRGNPQTELVYIDAVTHENLLLEVEIKIIVSTEGGAVGARLLLLVRRQGGRDICVLKDVEIPITSSSCKYE